MQNFSTHENTAVSAGSRNEQVDIKVSGVFTRDDRKIAYVSFTDGERSAEGIIPDCVITRNKGFSEDEKSQLEAYMKRELASLKKTASGINVVKALMEPGLT